MKVLLSALIAAVALVPGAAHAAVVVAGPDATSDGYAIEQAATVAGTSLWFVTADFQPHNVVSVDPGPAGNPWCGAANLPSRCPLFASATLNAGATEVRGVAAVPPGTYGFYCTIHPVTMRGTLTVL